MKIITKQRVEASRKMRERLKQEFLSHTPTTDILDRIKEVTPDRGVLLFVTITPELARDIMSWNTDNRPTDFPAVDRYTGYMENDKWVFIGDIIRLTHTYKVIDGQQRLQAIIRSGRAQIFHIQTGLDEEAFAFIDSGKQRSGGDALAIAGYKNYNVLSAAIKADIYYRTQQRVGAKVNVRRVEVSQIVHWTQNKANIRLMLSCIDYSIKTLHPKGKFLAQSNWAFLYYTFASLRNAKEQSSYFLTKLATGEDISMKHDPAIYLLREKLVALDPADFKTAGKFSNFKIRYVITAWNHFRAGDKITKLVIDTRTLDVPKPI